MGCRAFAMLVLVNKDTAAAQRPRANDRRGVKPQRATSSSGGVGLKACLVDNRIRRSPTRDSRSSSLVHGSHRLGPASADFRQLFDICPANKSAAFARNMLIFFDSWLPDLGSNQRPTD